DRDVVEQLAKSLGIDFVLSDLLVKRGIVDFEDARKFFRPDIRHLHDPFLMKDMDKAIERIEDAIANNERILVYGDYDVDGTTAVSLVYSFIKSCLITEEHTDQLSLPRVNYYIPDRYREGYGISMQGIDFAAENNYSLIIALDCGIKSVREIKYASDKGVDFIICDHHMPGAEIPDAVAVLDTKRKDCTYPYKELSGCGLGFKLIQAYAEKHDMPFECISCYLDLVAISIACDIVHITDENRVLAYYGLEKLNSDPCIGVKALM